MKIHRKIYAMLLLLTFWEGASSQYLTGDSLRVIKTISLNGWTTTYDNTMGIVYRDSLSRIQKIEVFDIGNDGNIGSEIQNAINALPSIGGKIVLPAGSFGIGNADPAISILTDKNTGQRTGITIEGAGIGVAGSDTPTTGTILKYTGTGTAFKLGDHFDIDSKKTSLSDCTFRKFRVVKNEAVADTAFSCVYVRRCLFEDVLVQGFKYGFNLKFVSDFNTFNRVFTRHTPTQAMRLYNQCNGNLFLNCDFAAFDTSQNENGVSVEFVSDDNSFISCRFHNFGASISNMALNISGSSGTYVQGCYFEDVGKGVRIMQQLGTDANGTNIISNYFNQMRHGFVGVYLDSYVDSNHHHYVNNTTVEGNIFIAKALNDTAIGIYEYLGPYGNNLVLFNNSFVNFASHSTREQINDPSIVANWDNLQGVFSGTNPTLGIYGADFETGLNIVNSSQSSTRSPNLRFQDGLGSRISIRKESNGLVFLDSSNNIKATLTTSGRLSVGDNTLGDSTFYSPNGLHVRGIKADGNLTTTQLKLAALNTAPSSSIATGITGEIRIDANYIYICTNTNTWKRIAISSW
jgi:hypothetical protein